MVRVQPEEPSPPFTRVQAISIQPVIIGVFDDPAFQPFSFIFALSHEWRGIFRGINDVGKGRSAMGRLTVAMVRSLAKPGRYGDGRGSTLYLVIAPGGSRSWVQRLAINGKRHDIGLGGWPLTSLEEARERAFANRKLARDGGDPLALKRRAAVPTFEQAAARTFEANRARWRGAKTAANRAGSMATYAYPVIGDRRVDQIGWGRRPPRPDPDLVVQARPRRQGPRAHPRRPVVVSGTRLRRAQRGRRGHRRRAAEDGGRQGASPGARLPRGRGGSRPSPSWRSRIRWARPSSVPMRGATSSRSAAG